LNIKKQLIFYCPNIIQAEFLQSALHLVGSSTMNWWLSAHLENQHRHRFARELLALIKEKDRSFSHPDSVFTMNDKVNKALRAVVEYHKPYKSKDYGLLCGGCDEDPNYPCGTIRAIEKELG
jgi:hypothetical protein